MQLQGVFADDNAPEKHELYLECPRIPSLQDILPARDDEFLVEYYVVCENGTSVKVTARHKQTVR